jgi:hypothetical protein
MRPRGLMSGRATTKAPAKRGLVSPTRYPLGCRASAPNTQSPVAETRGEAQVSICGGDALSPRLTEAVALPGFCCAKRWEAKREWCAAHGAAERRARALACWSHERRPVGGVSKAEIAALVDELLA